ncbi:uncharacterized protein [Nicotiana tomentosiformis]|uniref:uncharacterized protein n=1 Tax=Nicotiana tomentosiformis TaxID=4098 RepID=UPI00388CB86D
MADRGRGRSRKDKRPIDHDDSATPTLPSTPHLHPSAADGRKQSSRRRSIPPHPSTHQTTHHSPAQQYYHHSSPHGYTPLPPHDPTNFSGPDHNSGLDRSRGLDRCRGVDRSHLHQGLRLSLHGVRLLAFLDFVFGIVALSQMPPPLLRTAHTSDSSEDDDPDDVRYDHYHRIIIRPEGNGFIPNHQVTKIITDILGGLYNAPYPTWSDFPEDLVQQMFNQFKTKCAWEDRYNREICKNWEYKCHKRLSDSFNSARKVKKKPSWVLPDVWVDLQRYWATEKFEKQSELGKKARASEKGGSLHCLGSRSMGDTRRQLEKNMGGR